MTTGSRAVLQLRLIGAASPDGEITVDDLITVANETQRTVRRLARALDGRSGTGRTPTALRDATQLVLAGLASGSTTLTFATAEPTPSLDLGTQAMEIADRAITTLIRAAAAASSGSEPGDIADDAKGEVRSWMRAIGGLAPEVVVTAVVRGQVLPEVSLSIVPETADNPELGDAGAAQVSVEGILYAVNLRHGTFRLEDDLGTSVDVAAAEVPQDVGHLLGNRVRATGHRPSPSGPLRIVDAELTLAIPDDVARTESVPLAELLEQVQPLDPDDDLSIPGLSEADVADLLHAVSR